MDESKAPSSVADILAAIEVELEAGKSVGKAPHHHHFAHTALTAGHSESPQLVEQLLSRSRSFSDGELAPLLNERGLQVLGRCAFEKTPSPRNLSALLCLNNLLARSVPMRQTFVDQGFPKKVVDLMKNGEPSQELATANLLLFCAAQTKFDMTPFFESDDLAGIINKNVSRHAESSEPPPADPAAPALAALRLLSTLAVRYAAQAHRFLESIDAISKMLDKVPASSPHLSLPTSALISTLASLPIHQIPSITTSVVDKLADILHTALITPESSSSERELLPLLLIIFRLAQSPPSASRSQLCQRILSSDDDRVKPLGQGDSLAHKLIHLATTTMEFELREMLFTLFFELSDKDPSLFVHNVGFGNAAGFLSSKGIQITQDDLKDAEGSNTTDINPITGQQRSAEPVADEPEMTQEEKEREAERLFVLFERLRANGVISAENPVAQYQQSGRFEELPDDKPEKD